MRVKQIMTPNPVCCTPDSTARQVAVLMHDHDCGSIPVVESTATKRLVGTVTDRDLAIRGLAAGRLDASSRPSPSRGVISPAGEGAALTR